MPYLIPLDKAKELFNEFEFISPLTPSEQKAAFHVRRADEDFCLKIISPNFTFSRIEREILAMQNIAHPNVVRLVEYGDSYKNGLRKHYILEEFIEGEDLSGKIGEGQKPPIEFICKLFSQLSEGLEALRLQNIVHRDLKPNNIRIDANGKPTIIDFGMARHLDKKSITETAVGAKLGTPKYFAPEQFIGSRNDVDHRTDLFALGVMMFEAFTGRHPTFNTDVKTLEELGDKICNFNGRSAAIETAEIPGVFKILIGKLLSKERSERPSKAAFVADFINRLGVPS